MLRPHSGSGPDERPGPPQSVRRLRGTRWLGPGRKVFAAGPSTGTSRGLHSTPFAHCPEPDRQVECRSGSEESRPCQKGSPSMMIRTVAGSKQSICQYLWHYVVTIPGRYIFFWKIDKNTTIILDADGFELRGGFHQRLKCRRYLRLILVAVSVRSFDEVAVLFVCDKICEQKIPEYSGWSKWSGNQSLFGKIVYRMCFFFYSSLIGSLISLQSSHHSGDSCFLFSAIKIPCVLFSCDLIGRKVSSGAIAREEWCISLFQENDCLILEKENLNVWGLVKRVHVPFIWGERRNSILINYFCIFSMKPCSSFTRCAPLFGFVPPFLFTFAVSSSTD